jgi:hypothetical protein
LVALVLAAFAAGPGSAAAGPVSATSSFRSVEPPGSSASGESPALLSSVPLLDFSRLRVSHALSYTFSSGGARNTSTGLFVSSFDYRVASPLSMRLDVGAVMDRAQASAGRGPEVFLKGLGLDYHPSDSFRLQLSYRNLPRSAWYGAPGLRPGE